MTAQIKDILNYRSKRYLIASEPLHFFLIKLKSIDFRYFPEIEEENYLDSLSEGKDYDITINTDDDYGSKVDALVKSMGVTVEEESTTHRRRDLDSL